MAGDKKIRHDYLSENPADELQHSLTGEVWDQVRDAWGYGYNPPYGSEIVHHIYNSALGAKNDVWSLLITVGPAAHEFVHKCPKHGVIACVWAKLQKDEFDREEVAESLGRDLVNRIVIWRDNEEIMHPYYMSLVQEIEDKT